MQHNENDKSTDEKALAVVEKIGVKLASVVAEVVAIEQ
jgi:hypothetical protein